MASSGLCLIILLVMSNRQHNSHINIILDTDSSQVLHIRDLSRNLLIENSISVLILRNISGLGTVINPNLVFNK